MSRTKSFLQNSCASIVQEIIVLGAGLVTPRIMLSYYGSEIIGLIASLTHFFSYFNLVEAGLSGAAVYALYAPLATGDHYKISAVMVAIKRFYEKSGYLFVALAVLLAITYPFFVTSDKVSSAEIGILTLVVGVNGCIDFFTLGKYRALLSADQSIRIISYANSLHYILNTILIYFGAYFGFGIVVVKSTALMSIFVRTALLVVYCHRHYAYINYDVVPDYDSLNKRWSAFYLQLLGIVQNATPIVIITIVLRDLKVASVYAVYAIVTSGISSVMGVFTSGLSASFGDVIVRKETKILQRAYSEFELVYYAVLTIISAVSFATIQPFINLYTKGITDTSYNLPFFGFLVVLNLLLYNVKTPQGMMVISAGHYQETRWQSSIQASIIVLAGVPLAHLYGIYGVMYGLILSNIYRDIDLMFYIPTKVTHTKVIVTAKRILRIGVCIGVFYWLNRTLLYFDVTDWWKWIEYVLISGVLAVVIVIGFNYLLDKETFISVHNRINFFFSND